MSKRLIIPGLAVLMLAVLLAQSRWQSVPPVISGFIEVHSIRLGSLVGGRVAKVHAEEGSEVKAGQVLVELDPFDLSSREDEARARLAAKQAEYARVKTGFRKEEIIQARHRRGQLKADFDRLADGPRTEEIGAAKARLTAAEAQLVLARQLFQRAERLLASKAAARDDVERAAAAVSEAEAMRTVRAQELELLKKGAHKEELAAAKARLEEADAALDLLEAGSRPEDVQAAEAGVAAAQAVLDVLLRQKEELNITAPADGVVESLALRPGDMAAPGAPVISLLEAGRLWIRTYLPESRMLRPGERLAVRVDAFPGETFPGEVSFISRQAEFAPGSIQTPEERSKQVFRVKITLLDGKDRLRAGMSADLVLPEPHRDE
jgi:multidrug resistance efflux pump